MVYQRLVDSLQHHEAVLEDFVVPEAQYVVSLLSQKFIAFFVVGVLFRMLAAVQFNQQFLGHAGEVYDVRAYGLLATEFVAVELFVAQVVPEEAFGIGLAFSEGLGFLEGLLGVGAFDLLPFPPTGSAADFVLALPTPPQGGSDV